MAKSKYSDTTDLDKLAKLFGIPTSDELSEMNDFSEAYSAGRREALADGATEDEADEKGLEYEQAEQDELYSRWSDGVTHVADELFGRHGLELSPKHPDKKSGRSFEYKIFPSKSWNDAANKIRETVNGVGDFHFNTLKEFLDSGPYTAREAVLSHLGYISDWPNVYGNSSPSRMYSDYVR